MRFFKLFMSFLLSSEAALEGCEKNAVALAVRQCALFCTRNFLTIKGCETIEDAKGGSRMAVLKMAEIPYCEMAFQEEIVKCFAR
ncbi:Oidioi.mRNA.OKI2018_I69.chr2.g4849.t1.cds [Oikopleura dioica]|uniref:Oidioi.mRNA.OKI2018_I69.chr2.g4849.t1.cds n=1 Tax=Oikopleura dioica TaxID=34765 RepID=A0ABN7T4A9_OIKDI|nr:Oidioi.mRNA.OKI2018_I69.chr2.g4849.t1.cds [Oikopleura dioica]